MISDSEVFCCHAYDKIKNQAGFEEVKQSKSRTYNLTPYTYRAKIVLLYMKEEYNCIQMCEVSVRSDSGW